MESEVDKGGVERKTEEERGRKEGAEKARNKGENAQETAECAKESECVNLPPVVAYNATLNRAPALNSTQLPIMMR